MVVTGAVATGATALDIVAGDAPVPSASVKGVAAVSSSHDGGG
jgi:hypothetical protein